MPSRSVELPLDDDAADENVTLTSSSYVVMNGDGPESMESAGKEQHGDDTSMEINVSSMSRKRVVHTRVVFLKFGEIDTLKETFTADILIQAKWREPTLDGYERAKCQTSQAVNFDELWNPKIMIDNTYNDPKETTSLSVLYDVHNWQAYVVERRKVRGAFLENLELFQFPFDTQDLTVTLISELPDDEVELDEDPNHMSTINRESFVDEQEWRLYNEVVIIRETKTKVTTEYDVQSHSSLSCRTHASRRPGFYIYSVFLVMCLICSMTFCTFAVDMAKRESRLQLSFILLLTTVTFKFAVNSSLPRISYLTTMDVYILSSMVILTLICVWHAIVFRVYQTYGEERAETADKYVLMVLGLSYLIEHVVFCVWVSLRTVKLKRKHEDLEQQHKMKLLGQKRLSLSTVPRIQSVRRAVSSASASLAVRRLNKKPD